MQPHRFYIRGRPETDAHVYAPRTRFIPEALLELFERQVRGGSEAADALDGPRAARVDVKARLREMWK
jgi:DNA helicase-2/ATP-dependent DNA helicase PcrA